MLLALKAQPSAGNTIKGMVVDSVSKLPLEYATITIFAKGSKKPLSGTVTDKAGKFSLKEIKDGIYTIEFEFIYFTKNTTKGKLWYF